jgi:3-deoxy-manno-octulosonate cytidylyltransferase (CMP-KDO synthetase)
MKYKGGVKYVVIIPARYQSSRLPGKPLISISGLPMIVRTYLQCLKVEPAKNIFVATDDERIESICREHEIQVLMTSSDCLTGTDRVAEVAEQIEADIYINVQGDEPVFNPDDLTMLIKEAIKYPHDVINGYTKIYNDEQFRSISIPKVVMRPDGRLLYMSRSPIPSNKQNDFVFAFRQVCAYAFPRDALKAYSALGTKTTLENIEDIEILRFLELGREIRMIPLSSQSVAVDNREDIAKAEARIIELGL